MPRLVLYSTRVLQLACNPPCLRVQRDLPEGHSVSELISLFVFAASTREVSCKAGVAVCFRGTMVWSMRGLVVPNKLAVLVIALIASSNVNVRVVKSRKTGPQPTRLLNFIHS